MPKAIGYPRVSTEEQSQTGVSLGVQEQKIRAFCELYSITLVDVVSDPGESGKTLDRPGIKSVLERLDAGEADGIVVAKLDRLSRSVGDWDSLIANYFGEKAGFQLWSVGECIDTRTAGGRLVLNVLMSVAQWERETISERVTAALAYKKSRNERISGRVDYGFELAPDGVHLVPCSAEQTVLAMIRTMRADGMTLQGIAAELNTRGIHRRSGGQWEHRFVSKLLSRKAA
jgi:DNA invertase Pin-like site-specific DNA recombinase